MNDMADIDNKNSQVNSEKNENREDKGKNRHPVLLALGIVFVLIAAIIIGANSFAKNTDGPVGYWKVVEASAGEVTMTQDDAEALGLSAIGTFKFNKSGGCDIVLIGNEHDGKWSEDGSGNITIIYDDKTITASIGEDGVMSAEDNEGTKYKLCK